MDETLAENGRREKSAYSAPKATLGDSRHRADAGPIRGARHLPFEGAAFVPTAACAGRHRLVAAVWITGRHDGVAPFIDLVVLRRLYAPN